MVFILDNYKEKQYIVFRQLKKSLDSRLSHAYIFSVNNNIYADDIIYSFAKSIVCPFNYTNDEKCGDCNICGRIESKNYSEIKEIYPDGLWIKKDQLAELKESLNTKPIEGKKIVYIIHEVEKLNKQAANSLLKFLEEPSEDIIAILVTNNINSVVDTIVSRCQNIILKKNNITELDNEFSSEDITLRKISFLFEKNMEKIVDIKDKKLFLDNIIDFIIKIEENKLRTINSAKKYFHDKFQEKDDIIFAFELIILFYMDVIYYKTKGNEKIFNEYISVIKHIAEINDMSKIFNKINILIKSKELIKNNVNTNLLLDKLIIEFVGRK